MSSKLEPAIWSRDTWIPYFGRSQLIITWMIHNGNRLSGVQFGLLLYIVLTISILIGQEPPAYFENSRDFVNKYDYLSNRPQVSMGYRLINHAGCW